MSLFSLNICAHCEKHKKPKRYCMVQLKPEGVTHLYTRSSHRWYGRNYTVCGVAI